MHLSQDSRVKLTYSLVHTLELAALAGFRQMRHLCRKRRRSYYKRQPGIESPMWTSCVPLLRKELRRYGAKSQLARYLGIPRQRVYDYLKKRSRVPDAEIGLRMVHWLAERAMDRDPAL